VPNGSDVDMPPFSGQGPTVRWKDPKRTFFFIMLYKQPTNYPELPPAFEGRNQEWSKSDVILRLELDDSELL